MPCSGWSDLAAIENLMGFGVALIVCVCVHFSKWFALHVLSLDCRVLFVDGEAGNAHWVCPKTQCHVTKRGCTNVLLAGEVHAVPRKLSLTTTSHNHSG